jgi:N-acetyl-anhydromuramyl-L-alanine amidase AmpD
MKVKVTSSKGEELMRSLVAYAPMDFVEIVEDAKPVPTVPPAPKPDPAKMPPIEISEFDSPNQSVRNATISAIILHNTSGSFDGAVSWLCNPDAQASAHLVIGRQGQTACIVDFPAKAWHAGNAEWNACSIGIEIEAYEGAEGMTIAQEGKVIAWVKWMMQKYGIKADRIKIHRQVCSTDCPGFIWKTDAEFLTWRKANFGV